MTMTSMIVVSKVYNDGGSVVVVVVVRRYVIRIRKVILTLTLTADS